MTEAVDVQHLFFSYDTNVILRDVTFSIESGAFVAFFGPNGGGKTTLLHVLMGFLKPQKGSVKLLGLSPKEMGAHIGWVPQNFHFDKYFPISVLEVVLQGRLFALKWHGRFLKEDREVAYRALEEVGLKAFADDAFSNLSGGQKQRVLIARALVSKPKILLLDEATSNVDAAAQREIFQLLQNLKGKITILMVTHDLSAAIQQVDSLFCVQGAVTAMTKTQVCEHFALGLYHSPLRQI